ncbi:VOC family protein [Sciscionella sediminilitoris]|uniref:VOC family protein n=1 Tax=Sciscionella sediminilitoris TaxID=1445613 RepID=UPI0004DF02A3|nr:VOC family protein [Sciscionella sp. SE31]
MEILASRVLIRPADLEESLRFYRDALGLAVHREFPGGVVFFAGQGLIEVSGSSSAPATPATQLWLQVRSLGEARARLAEHAVRVLRGAEREPWGLDEMWIADPDGRRIVLVEVPEEHPMRRDTRWD